MRASLPEDTDNMTDIPVPKFSDHYFQMSALDGALIGNEYKVINAIDMEALGYTTLAAKQNDVKNRYTNIHPYDQNRVLLTGANDYVNASYVDVSGLIEGWLLKCTN
jgi:Protein-tyrosine phosphatase